MNGAVKARTVGFVVLNVRFGKEGDQWLAECAELGTATYGDTLEEVQAEIKELIDLHLNTLEETGRREKFFKEHKIKFYRTDAEVPGKVEIVVEDITERDTVFSKSYKVAVPA